MISEDELVLPIEAIEFPLCRPEAWQDRGRILENSHLGAPLVLDSVELVPFGGGLGGNWRKTRCVC